MLPKPFYDEDGITIYHGDCRDILPHLPKVELVLTDPPYGIGLSSGWNGRHNDCFILGDEGGMMDCETKLTIMAWTWIFMSLVTVTKVQP